MNAQLGTSAIRVARVLVALVVLPLGAATLGACGDDDTAASETTTTSDTAMTSDATATSETTTMTSDATVSSDTATTTGGAMAPDDAAFPATVEHALGSTTIESRPERVVTVGTTEQDNVLALGIAPVGINDWYGDQPFATWPWAHDELGDAEPTVLSSADGFQYETIAGLEPDLIIGTSAGLDEQSYALLSEIAPTIAHASGAPAYFGPWREQARMIAAALGESEQMESIIADVEHGFAQAREEHPEFEGISVAFLQNAFYDGKAIAYQEGLSTDFLTDLGFTIPDVLDDFEAESQAEIPLEQLSVLDDADVLLWATENEQDRAALESEPLYNNLDAVQGGSLVFTDGITAGAIYFTSPLSLPFALDQLVPAFAATITGQGPAVTDA